jgi:peptidoglycan/xylan/chitin deacetylase (PgdA/CDA1 family)
LRAPGRLAATLLPAARTLRSRRSVILAYHGVGASTSADDPEFMRVHPDALRAQLELLLAAGFSFVSAAELAERVTGGPPPGLAALSFDDGMEDNHSLLLPLLREYGLPATVYVCTGLVGKPNPWVRGARMMTERELRALAEAGVEIGAHGVSHSDLSQLGYEDCMREMVDSREWLERVCGRPVRTFAYPFCRYGESAARAARDAGFVAALTCHGRGSWAPYELQRAMITGKDGLPSFVAKLWDLYGPVFHSPPVRLARVATRGLRGRLRSARETRDGR